MVVPEVRTSTARRNARPAPMNCTPCTSICVAKNHVAGVTARKASVMKIDVARFPNRTRPSPVKSNPSAMHTAE